ncbi:allophanate hydrolase [Kaistia dalseonensis]|uniref:Allophanate hydrolase n=1 Tax=Kaistia dalseonensis TaxID=410840 RepID=A0ABU0HD04_9HYPH|nr:allophanate hydrolase [Kaistia dalseonensis]MCX5497196.1 allophanate hydrolase [Kaistia dalseonensis]MDQ0439827.1 allophanate hydrolase [Kaistia dalseonensis]
MTATWSPATGSLDIATLQRLYTEGALTPSAVIDAIYDRIAARGDDHVWIYLAPRADLLAEARKLEETGPTGDPLWGIPFSVKDCNDVPGMPTTNALPEMAYTPETTGQAMNRLLESGALCLGKVNMDQFGIGLVGVRTPYGACSSVFNEEFISGGSSSGSGVSVGAGLVSFSVANDAAGSGRVPAAFNNIVGLKPTPGFISNSSVSGGGSLKSAETMTVFALTVEDAVTVGKRMGGYDPSYEFSKPEADQVDLTIAPLPKSFRFGVPAGAALRFFGDDEAAKLFDQAIARLETMGGTRVDVDFTPFEETQKLLYGGPFIAERALSMDAVTAQYREHIHPVTLSILETSSNHTAVDVFRAIHKVAALKRDTRATWDAIDILLVPTTPTIYRKSEILADPIQLNAQLGIYTNFVNLMGMCGVAVPNGFRPDGLPLGVTFLAPSWQDAKAASFAAAFQKATGLPLGATGNPLPA